MVIACAKCGKSFRLPDDKIKPTGTRVRCNQCGHEFVVMPSPPVVSEIPELRLPDESPGGAPPSASVGGTTASSAPDTDPLTVTPASGLQRTNPPVASSGDVASSYEITFQGMDPGTGPAAAEEPPSGGMSDADLVSALQSDPLLADSQSPAGSDGPSRGAESAVASVPEGLGGGDVSIDFGVLDEVPEPPPPVAPSSGAAPMPEMGSSPMDVAAAAPAPESDPFQLDNLSLEEPPPDEHGSTMMGGPPAAAAGSHGEIGASGADPLAGLDLDFTLDEKALGGAESAAPAPPPPPPPAPEPSMFEPTSVSTPPPVADSPAAMSQRSLKDEFDSLGSESLVKGNLDEIQAPEPSAFQPPPSRAEEPMRPATAPATVAAKVSARMAEKEKKPVRLRRLELRSPVWLSAPIWAILLSGLGMGVWVTLPGLAGAGRGGGTVAIGGSTLSSWIGLRPITQDVSPSIRQVRGRTYQNAYGERFYLVTGVVPKLQAETQGLRATFLDAQGWKMGEEIAYWVTEIPPREFALLGLNELRQALKNLSVDFQSAPADIPFVIVYQAPLKTPDRFILEWTDRRPAPSGS